jgi:hypothetical protein
MRRVLTLMFTRARPNVGGAMCSIDAEQRAEMKQSYIRFSGMIPINIPAACDDEHVYGCA